MQESVESWYMLVVFTSFCSVWMNIVVCFCCHSPCGSVDWNTPEFAIIPNATAVVTPLAGVWIEIPARPKDIAWVSTSLPLRECGLKSVLSVLSPIKFPVTPLAGVWIEIFKVHRQKGRTARSLPLRECGLKYACRAMIALQKGVTPLAGVWIEIISAAVYIINLLVTPLAGVWIEIKFYRVDERGQAVTPLAGVWIEIISFTTPK